MMHLFEKSFAPSLATAYGPHLTTALAMAQTHLQIAIAATVPGLPKSESDTPLPYSPFILLVFTRGLFLL
eukprot:m.110639 g.110639  ORF g.110639 m.110639 type:complete len:70 (+) comp37412_c0_seq2:7339-7548(+)